uniref:37S ribosomal protein S12, mitochondrial n=1 Tax=Sphaerodactylus townsendi TaxID=933632 RepID=A0ACB8EQP4_9SAUR
MDVYLFHLFLKESARKSLCRSHQQALQELPWPPSTCIAWVPTGGPHPNPAPTDGCPQLKAVVLKTFNRKPKKPNSANWKCACVCLSTGKEAICFIPGEGHNLQEHSIVMVEGGHTQDLPGVKLKVVHGKYDCAHVIKKK